METLGAGMVGQSRGAKLRDRDHDVMIGPGI
jgi:hypothetical protein